MRTTGLFRRRYESIPRVGSRSHVVSPLFAADSWSFLLPYLPVLILQNMMAHIRYATQGEVSLENVHPFSRELWGIQWTFCQ